VNTSEWIISQTDEVIIDWANKGLFRRAQKVLDKQSIYQWSVGENSATGFIEGYDVHVHDVGFDNLQCNCASASKCYHMIVLLLGLRAHIQTEQSRISSCDSNQGTHSIDYSSTPKEEDNPPPWLVTDKPAYFSKVTWEKAERWYAQEIELNSNKIDVGFQFILELEHPYRVTIPKKGGLDFSVCNCKKTKCAHRAYAVYSESVKAGLITAKTSIETLSDHQQQVLDRVDTWLQFFLLKGLVSLSDTQLQSGLALATELTQPDLPKPGKVTHPST